MILQLRSQLPFALALLAAFNLLSYIQKLRLTSHLILQETAAEGKRLEQESGAEYVILSFSFMERGKADRVKEMEENNGSYPTTACSLSVVDLPESTVSTE